MHFCTASAHGTFGKRPGPRCGNASEAFGLGTPTARAGRGSAAMPVARTAGTGAAHEDELGVAASWATQSKDRKRRNIPFKSCESSEAVECYKLTEA